jgi:hypothetical protein
LYGILIDLNLSEDKKTTGIPAGEEFGFQLQFLSNPESTKPTDTFYVVIIDSERDLITKLDEDKTLYADTFVMHATQPASLILASVKNEPKLATKSTLVEMTITTSHLLPSNSQLEITVPQ